MGEQDTNTSRISALRRSIRSRRAGRTDDTTLAGRLRALVRGGGLGPVAVVLVALVIPGTLLAWWVRTQPLVSAGRVMDRTHVVRAALTVEDASATAEQREAARQRTPRVFVGDAAVFDELRAALLALPATLSSVPGLDGVDPTLREQYGLTEERLAALRPMAVDGEPAPAWGERVWRLVESMRLRPLVDGATYQRATQEGAHSRLELVLGDRRLDTPRGELLNVEDAEAVSAAALVMARDAGFEGALREVVAERISRLGRPTYSFDEAATAAAMEEAARGVGAVIRESPVGRVVFRAGERLTEDQLELFKAERKAYAARRGVGQVVLERAAMLGLFAAGGAALAGYAALFVPRLRGSTPRFASATLVLLGALAVSCVGAAAEPSMMALWASAPALLAAVVLVIGLDNRSALALGVILSVLTAAALRLSAGGVIVMVTGVALASWLLQDVRDRRTLLRAAAVSGAGLAAATVLTGLIERGAEWPMLRQTLIDAGVAGVGALFVGAVAMFALPAVERVFDVATGLTLIELRDPRQPLLRELQLRAPGTYTHSLNVATIAEAAADAVGADSLLTYVGALYHDIGKMNKPEYFVENQSGGPNKHDRLSPAMSLLVIVGHVKDGMELAREFRLPVSIRHFIESHHGTTLVEYFFHRARKQAIGLASKGPDGKPKDPAMASEPEESQMPDEFEYRYPGPKPRTRESAILMIADAVESAARTLDDPTPARVDGLVRAIATRRLTDGQFDDCAITLSELNRICDSVSRTVASLHHGRIQYPEGEEEQAERRA